jgi:hypothetical protein
MLKKYASKFVMDILPSVTATVIGAYLVNHYINKPVGPVAAAVSTVTAPKADDTAAPKAAETSAAVEAGATKAAKAADKAPVEKASQDKASQDKAADKPSDKPAATASPAPEKRWHLPMPRDKVAKTAPAAPAAAAAGPSPATTASVSPAPQPEATPAQEERRDANDLARAAIERLRASGEPSRSADTTPRVAAPPLQPSAQQLQPLPPAVVLAAPGVTTGEAYYPGNAAAPARSSDARRMTPPADIPAPPIDLHADAAAPQRASVADDVVSAARSVFQSVVP